MTTRFLLCIDDGGHPESLEPRKFYEVVEVVEDPAAAVEKMVRVIDESGDDYLYPKAWFIEVPLTSSIEGQLRSA